MREFEEQQRTGDASRPEILAESAAGRAALEGEEADEIADGEQAIVTGEVTEEDMRAVELLSSKERRQFAHFQAVIDKEPEQVLRYCFQEGARPLWPSTLRVPTAEDIPNCSCCGAARRFEFQVLPTLINFLEVDATDPDSADWGMIAVYTCSASCTPKEGGYAEEFVWVQADAQQP